MGVTFYFSAHVPIFIGDIVLRLGSHLWIMSLYVILMDWSCAHGPIFIANKLSDKKVRFFIRLTVGAHDSIFAPIFVYDKKSDRVR